MCLLHQHNQSVHIYCIIFSLIVTMYYFTPSMIKTSCTFKDTLPYIRTCWFFGSFILYSITAHRCHIARYYKACWHNMPIKLFFSFFNQSTSLKKKKFFFDVNSKLSSNAFDTLFTFFVTAVKLFMFKGLNFDNLLDYNQQPSICQLLSLAPLKWIT